MENPDEKLLWTMDQVADQFGVCTKTISRLITNDELPVVRIGRNVRIEARVVHHFVEQREAYNGRAWNRQCGIQLENAHAV